MIHREPRFSLRPVLAADLPAVMELERLGFDPDIREPEAVFARRRELFPEGFLFLIDERSQAVGGYYCAERWAAVPDPRAAAYELGGDPSVRSASSGPVLYTASMTVAPAFRGAGAGSFLFREARARILSAFPSIETELLIVRASWSAARRVYAAEGFRETALLSGFFSAEENGAGVVMEKASRRP